MLRPFRGYEELATADEEHGRPSVVVGMARLAFMIGAFVALTATGRLAPFELVSGMISFAYVPVVHVVAVAAAMRLVAPDVSVKRAYALYAEGYGPWFVLMLAIAGGSLFVHEPARIGITTVMQPTGYAVFAWGGLITYACFRSGLGLSRGRAALAMLVHYVVITTCVLGFFLLAGQLLPIL